jgi:hypothetical protein
LICDVNGADDEDIPEDDGPPDVTNPDVVVISDDDVPIGEGDEDSDDGWGEGLPEYEDDENGLEYNPDDPTVIDWPDDVWEFDDEDSKWDYIGDPDEDWKWNREDQVWEYVGDEDEDWTWNEEENEWEYEEDPGNEWEWEWDENRGEWKYVGDPDAKWSWDKAELKWDYVGPISTNWRWDKANQNWDYIGPFNANWSWDKPEQKWTYTGPANASWSWDKAQQEWDYVGSPVPDWNWNKAQQTWNYTGPDPQVPTAPAGPPSIPPAGPPSIPPANAITDVPPSPGPPAERPTGLQEAYTGALSFTDLLITYPDVFYLYSQPGFASAKFRITVDNPPVRGPLIARISDGQHIYSLAIKKNNTESQEITIATNGNVFNTGCTTRALSVVGWEGGGYTGPVAMDTTATQSFEVCSYTGTVSMLDPGYWQLVSGSWEWIGPEVTDWTFNAGTQQWTYGGEDSPAPPIPHPLPTTMPPGAGYLTMVVGVQVDNMPVHNAINDLVLTLSDGTTSYGDLTIPAVPRGFGVSQEQIEDGITQFWEYNPATDQWAYRNPPVNWRWHSDLGEWQWLASSRDVWAWNTEAEGWESIGGDNGSWTWDVESQDWEWTGEGSPGINDDEPDGPPDTTPPTNGGSTFPPDASQWTWDPEEYEWTGSAYSLEGEPPVEEWKAYRTLHFVGSVE